MTKKKTTIKLAKSDAPKHRYKHNRPIMESLLLSLTVYLSLGLLLAMSFNVVKDYLSSLQKSKSDVDIDSWVHVHHHGQTKVTQRHDQGRPFNTFRFQYHTDIPLDAIIDVLDDPIQTKEWFAWVVVDKEGDVTSGSKYPKIFTKDMTIVQMNVPYLHHHKREFLFETKRNEVLKITQTQSPIEKIQETSFGYHSINNETMSISCENCKRGELEMSVTLSSQDDEGLSTDIEMIVYMNLNSARIPSFILNMLTKEWGYISMMKLVKLCHSNLGLKDAPDIKMMFYNLFPVKR